MVGDRSIKGYTLDELPIFENEAMNTLYSYWQESVKENLHLIAIIEDLANRVKVLENSDNTLQNQVIELQKELDLYYGKSS